MISVVIPVYKVEEYLGECISSVVKQSYTDVEIVLVDDGSPDKCPMICDEWAQKDGRIKVIHQENKGLSGARNTGMDAAKGDYITFIDSDDFVEPTYIERLYNALQENEDCSIASCSCCQYVNGEVKPISYDSWRFNETRFIEPEDYAERMLLMKSQHTAWGKLFKASILKNIRFREGYNNEDILFALDFFPQVERENIRTVEIPDQLYYYRYRPGSISLATQGAFYYTQFINNGIVWKTILGKKQTVFDHYYKEYLKQLINIITLKLQEPVKYNCSIVSLYQDLWRYKDQYAKSVLCDEEYSSYLNRKYHPLLIWLKYKLLRA